MTLTTSLLGILPGGSKPVAVGHFTAGSTGDVLWEDPSGSLFLWVMSEFGVVSTTRVSLPPAYAIIGVGDYSISNPGINALLLVNSSGELAYGLYASQTSSFSAVTIGDPGSGWAVVGSASYNIANYFGDNQVLLENQYGTLYPYQSNAPQIQIPSGFTVVPNSAGSFFGADLPETLIVNAGGTVEALMDAATVNARAIVSGKVTVQTTPTAISSVIGTLVAGETIVAVGGRNADGSTDIVTQQSGILDEWVIDEGAIQQIVTVGALLSGFVFMGMGDISGNGATDILLMNNTGTVEIVSGSPGFAPDTALLNSTVPAICLDGNYDTSARGITTIAGSTATLSDYLAELTSIVSFSAIGARMLTIQQGALSLCSYEQVVAGNLTLAAWEENVAILNAIARYCRVNSITVQVETQLGWTGNFGAAQTYQWLNPALAAGLPIGYVEDDYEAGTATTILNGGSIVTLTANGNVLYDLTTEEYSSDQAQIGQDISIMAANELTDIAIIHAALPNAVFGEWDITGAADATLQPTGYHQFLQDWYRALGTSAAAEGLPSISYVIADQYNSPVLVSSGTVNTTGQVIGANVAVNAVAGLTRIAAAAGVKVEIEDAMNGEDLNPLQALARQELVISQEATLGIAGIQLAGNTNSQPVSQAVNVPGATYNGAAEAAAITPLYQASRITTAGSVALTLSAQIVTGQRVINPIGGRVSVVATSADQANQLAVVLIDQTGTLSAAQCGAATVSQNGANTLILDGTPGDVAAELATLAIDETVAGPDSIDVEVFGSSGRVAGGVIDVLAASPTGPANFAPSQGGASPQLWSTAAATVNNGLVESEDISWATSDGLSSSDFIGGATITPVTQLLVDQPLMEQGLTLSGTAAALPLIDLEWQPSTWEIYDPINPGVSSPEGVPVTIAASKLIFDPITGKRQTQIDTIAPVPQSSYAELFPLAPNSYYFADGGVAITRYDTGPNSLSGAGLYAGGAGALEQISGGAALVIADGSTKTLAVGSMQTIEGIIDGVTRVVEVRYLGAASDPYDEVDQIFDPYSATPVLWQQINTVGIPTSFAGESPLPVPSATTVTEFNTGDNPDWDARKWGDDQAAAVTYEAGNWDSMATIAANGAIGVTRGVSWIGEGTILNAYTLAAPTILGWSTEPWTGNDIITGQGIAGDWVVVTGANGLTIGGGQVAADGSWAVKPSSGTSSFKAVDAQQFDLAGDSSLVATPQSSGRVLLGGAASQYAVADDNGSLYIQDTVAGRDGTQILSGVTQMLFTDGTGVFDPSGSAEDITRLYRALLDRQPDLAGLLAWTAQATGSNVPLEAVAVAIDASPEFIQRYGSLSDENFVNQLYQNALDRPSEAAGEKYWVDQLAAGVSRSAVALAIAESPESLADSHVTDGDSASGEIYRLYGAAFGRVPGAAEESYWVSVLAGGDSLAQVTQAFAGCPEFRADCGAQGVADVVTMLYQNALHRTPEPGGLQYWTAMLLNGTSMTNVLSDFSDCIESRALSAGATHANWVFLPT